MNDVMEWFTGLATISGLLYFLAGFMSAYVVHCVREKVKHKKVTIPWHLAGIAIGTVAIIVVTAQTQVAYNIARETALQSRACFDEFLRVVNTRTNITEENDKLSREQRSLLTQYNEIQDTMWAQLINPPPDIAKLNTADPARQAYGLGVVQKARDASVEISKRINEIELTQIRLAEERRKHPIPDPTCGK